jgi:hypothetical protein
MAIPQTVAILGLSRARIHQLIDEDKFEVDDLRVVGDKRMVIIKNAAVYAQLRAQEERAQRIAADKAEEERRILGRMAVKEVEQAISNDSIIKASKKHAALSFEPVEEAELHAVFPG